MGYTVKQFLLRHIKLVAAWIIIMTVYVEFGTSLSVVSIANSTTYAVAMLAASICMLMIGLLLFDMALEDTFRLPIADSTWVGVALGIASLCGGIVAFLNFIYVL